MKSLLLPFVTAALMIAVFLSCTPTANAEYPSAPAVGANPEDHLFHMITGRGRTPAEAREDAYNKAECYEPYKIIVEAGGWDFKSYVHRMFIRELLF